MLLVLSVWHIPVVQELIIPTPLLFHPVLLARFFATIASLYRCALNGFRRYYMLQSRLRLLDLVLSWEHSGSQGNSSFPTIKIPHTFSIVYEAIHDNRWNKSWSP
ncbi:hypothetical protein BJ165DRAFT_1614760, partial [Panaeolus papilionaceus]